MLTFEVLCVTMHQKDFSKVQEMNLHANVVFANQCDHTAYEELMFENYTAKMISTQTRGVGINRNLALLYASADICLLADDDVTYVDHLNRLIVDEFVKYPDADVIVFGVTTNDAERKPILYKKTKKRSRFSRSPWGAVRIAFRLNSIKKANVWFTSLFGGGCVFPSGEDSMWIKDLKKAGLTFYVSDKIIGEVSFETSTWFTGWDEKYYYGVGAYYAARYRRGIWIRFLYTLLRTRKKSGLNMRRKLKWLNCGRKGYRNMQSFQEYVSTNQLEV